MSAETIKKPPQIDHAEFGQFENNPDWLLADILIPHIPNYKNLTQEEKKVELERLLAVAKSRMRRVDGF